VDTVGLVASKSYSSSHSFLPLPTSPRLTSLPPSPESERLGVGRLFRCQCLSRRSISEKVPYQNEKLLCGCKILPHHLRSPSPSQIIRCFQVFYQAPLSFQNLVLYSPYFVTRQTDSVVVLLIPNTVDLRYSRHNCLRHINKGSPYTLQDHTHSYTDASVLLLPEYRVKRQPK
jgi:hypothetical protein